MSRRFGKKKLDRLNELKKEMEKQMKKAPNDVERRVIEVEYLREVADLYAS